MNDAINVIKIKDSDERVVSSKPIWFKYGSAVVTLETGKLRYIEVDSIAYICPAISKK